MLKISEKLVRGTYISGDVLYMFKQTNGCRILFKYGINTIVIDLGYILRV